MKIIISKSQWKDIGKIAGWIPDPLENEDQQHMEERATTISFENIKDFHSTLASGVEWPTTIIDKNKDSVTTIFTMKFNKNPSVLEKRKILIQNYLSSNLAQSLLTNLKNITKRKFASITIVNEGKKQSVSS